MVVEGGGGAGGGATGRVYVEKLDSLVVIIDGAVSSLHLRLWQPRYPINFSLEELCNPATL